MVVRKTSVPDKAILVHKGGLGDFFQVWPTLYAIRCAHPESTLLWAGNTGHALWLERLGIRPCPPGLRRSLDALYGTQRCPDALRPYEIFWFGLERRVIPTFDHLIHFFRGIVPEREVPPRTLYLEAAAALGIPGHPGWSGAFREWFGGREGATSDRLVLLFPGSGHPMKCWPTVQFFQLGLWLIEQGFSPVVVLGPAEVERGLVVDSLPALRPRTFRELQETMNRAALVIGNDSGPMHLAGMLGKSGIVLFGPTSPLRWGPLGLETVIGHCPERPCSATARIACALNACLRSISQEQVRAEVLRLWQKRNRLAPDHPE